MGSMTERELDRFHLTLAEGTRLGEHHDSVLLFGVLRPAVLENGILIRRLVDFIQ